MIRNLLIDNTDLKKSIAYVHKSVKMRFYILNYKLSDFFLHHLKRQQVNAQPIRTLHCPHRYWKMVFRI